MPPIFSLWLTARREPDRFSPSSATWRADRWRIYLALCLVPLALLLDIADGRIARRLNEHSLFGGELDFFADIVSFGVAPAVLAYGLGMRGGLDMAILLIFVACGDQPPGAL